MDSEFGHGIWYWVFQVTSTDNEGSQWVSKVEQALQEGELDGCCMT